MAVRTAYAPVAATVLTAANLAKFASGWIGYIEVTANQAVITTAVDLTGLSLAVTVGTGRRIRISAMLNVSGNVASNIASISIQEGATVLQGISKTMSSTAGAADSAFLAAVITPTAGAHTYKLVMSLSSGGSSVNLLGSATAPSSILVEDLGATP